MGDTKEILVNPLDDLDAVDETIEETTLVPEEEKDNSDTTDDDQEEKTEEKKELTPKEIRHAQQEEGRVKEVMRLREMVIEAEVEKASQDATNLKNLSKKDPKLADEVARKFGYKDFRDANTQITEGEKTDTKKPAWMSKDDLEERYQERKAKDEHEIWLVEAKAILEKLPDDVHDEAFDEFNELVEGKTLTRAKALKLANMVTLSLTKVKPKTDTAEWLKKLSSTGISNSKKSQSSNMVEVIIDWKIVEIDEKTLLDSKKTY